MCKSCGKSSHKGKALSKLKSGTKDLMMDKWSAYKKSADYESDKKKPY